MLAYPTHSDYYSLALKFNISSLSSFFSLHFVCRGESHIQIDTFRITYVRITFLSYCTIDAKVNFEGVTDHVTDYIS